MMCSIIEKVDNFSLSPLPAKDLRKQPSHKDMEFDAIRQHRHFCPWISSTGNAAPGWQQTLSAILRQKEGSNPLPMESPSSTSMIEVFQTLTIIERIKCFSLSLCISLCLSTIGCNQLSLRGSGIWVDISP